MSEEQKQETTEPVSPEPAPAVDLPKTEDLPRGLPGTPKVGSLLGDEAPDAGEADKKDATEEVKLTLKEGSLLDDGIVDEIALYAKEQGLSTEQAQKLLDREEALAAKLDEKFVENANTMFEQQVSQWAEDSKKKFGPELKTNLNLAKRAMSLGSDEFRTSLLASGYGNRPEVIEFLAKVGKMIVGESFVNGSGSPPKRQLKPHEKLYGPDSPGT